MLASISLEVLVSALFSSIPDPCWALFGAFSCGKESHFSLMCRSPTLLFLRVSLLPSLPFIVAEFLITNIKFEHSIELDGLSRVLLLLMELKFSF
jgi:hypothetical protein